MKIGPEISLNRLEAEQIGESGRARELSKQKGTNASEDSVSLSDGSVRTSALDATDTTSINADRIARLREAVANGEYAIDPEKIAGGMLRELA